MTSLVEEVPVTRSREAGLLELRQLMVEYGVGPRRARAVDGVDLTIHEGEVLGLAGESGCGKTTIANAVMQILRPPAHIVGGSIFFDGEEILGRSDEELRRYRWRNVSMVLQSAMNALNPVMRVGDQFVDAMRAHEKIDRRRALARAGELLELVGIDRRRARSLSAPTVGRHAPASRDRDGALARARAGHSRRADHGPRRRGSAGDPAAGRGAQARLRLRGALHHARPVAPARVRRPDRDHVRGRDRGERHRRAPRRQARSTRIPRDS